MKKEKLIITVEIEDLPENANILDFQLTIIEDGFLSRIFKGWKKVTYKRAIISKTDYIKNGFHKICPYGNNECPKCNPKKQIKMTGIPTINNFYYRSDEKESILECLDSLESLQEKRVAIKPINFDKKDWDFYKETTNVISNTIKVLRQEYEYM